MERWDHISVFPRADVLIVWGFSTTSFNISLFIQYLKNLSICIATSDMHRICENRKKNLTTYWGQENHVNRGALLYSACVFWSISKAAGTAPSSGVPRTGSSGTCWTRFWGETQMWLKGCSTSPMRLRDGVTQPG